MLPRIRNREHDVKVAQFDALPDAIDRQGGKERGEQDDLKVTSDN